MLPEKPLLLIRWVNTNEALWCEDGPKISTATITTTPPSIHQAETRFSSGDQVRGEDVDQAVGGEDEEEQDERVVQDRRGVRRREVEDEVARCRGASTEFRKDAQP